MSVRLLPALSLAFAVAALTGCGFTANTAASATSSTAAPAAGQRYYHAFGDSITFGYSLDDPTRQAYPALVAADNHLPLTNLAISGNQACDVPTLQFIPHGDDPTLAEQGLYSLLISTNDVDVKGPGPYEAVFNLCHQASLAWLAVPVEQKVLATDAAVTVSGSTHLETSNRWNAQTTEASGASITFPVVLARGGAVYIWYRITDDSLGTFAYALDSVTVGTASSSTTPSMRTQAGTTTSLALLRLPSVAAGAHLLTITQTSDGDAGAGIVAVGGPSVGPATGLLPAGAPPRVLVGTTPPQLVGGFGACSYTTAPCQAYTADITANVALLAADGLDVQLFTTGKYMSATKADMADSLHPNARGQQEIAHALEDALSLP